MNTYLILHVLFPQELAIICILTCSLAKRKFASTLIIRKLSEIWVNQLLNFLLIVNQSRNA